MNNTLPRLLLTSVLLATSGLLFANEAVVNNSWQLNELTVTAVEGSPVTDSEKRPRLPRAKPSLEPQWESWAISLDNDILVPSNRDQDYTYGININFSGAAARDKWYSPYKGLAWLDASLGLGSKSPQNVQAHSLEMGLLGFTPEDIESANAIDDDRPYSSLVYLSSIREQVDTRQGVVWNSSLTVGVLGLPLVGGIQNSLHSAVGGDRANGWNNQISDGGELTARYAVARQRHLNTGNPNLEVKTGVQGTVGYLTEISWSLGFRAGQINSPWWTFNPQLASYGQQSAEITRSNRPERYFWAGVAIKARAYNAFLQGQFRDSEVSYDSNELDHLLLEAWAGYTLSLNNDYRISYMVRGHSSEIRTGAGDRNLLWGGIILSRAFL